MEKIITKTSDMYYWTIIINTCSTVFLLFLCYCSFNNLRVNFAVIVFSIGFSIVSISSTFNEFVDYRVFINHLPMHSYHLFVILYGFYFVRNALYLKYVPSEQKNQSLTEMNIMMKLIAEESKNPIAIFDQMLPIYGNKKFREEFKLSDEM